MSIIEQNYCQSAWGRVCYWSAKSAVPEVEATSLSENTIEIILFLHGVGGSGRYWFSYLERLTEVHRTSGPLLVIAPDLLGFGASAKPQLDYTSGLQLDIIKIILEDCLAALPTANQGQIKVSVIGHSMGGILAVLMAARLVADKVVLGGKIAKLNRLVLLGTPYPSPHHDMEQEVLRSPLNRAMLSRPWVCETVHHSLKFIWPLALFLISRKLIKTDLPFPVLADYMQHTCQSYTSNANQIIFHNNLEPALRLLETQSSSWAALLIYSRADKEVPWQHGQELAVQLKNSTFKLLETVAHVKLGQIALNEVVNFL